ncbi:MAG: phosphotransferase [Desulfobacteraceae bacterium]|nr:phosphotransferase [Desulfobacteraceae bacterium]
MSIMAETPGLGDLVAKALEISGGSDARVEPLAGDGSDRRFFRIFCGTVSYVGLLSPRVRLDGLDENDSYLRIGNHLLSKGIPVPRIVFGDAEAGRFLLEDAGDCHLQKLAAGCRQNLLSVYRPVIVLLADLHRKAGDGFRPDFCFDSHIYDPRFVFERELEYFRRAFCNGYLRLEVGPEDLRSDFEMLAEQAGAVDTACVFHRDFQSRNIMVTGEGLRLIDFQGMRFGPPAYDLASLLVDPYVEIPAKIQNVLLGEYWAVAADFFPCDREGFLRDYYAVRLCRNLQILGAFGFLGVEKAKLRFLRYIPWAWEQLLHHLHSDRCAGRYPRLEALVNGIQLPAARCPEKI